MCLTWEPRLQGDRYCSTACGYGCTWSDYQKAEKDAEKLCRALGPQWTPRVWENLGWHYNAEMRTSTKARAVVYKLSGGYCISLMMQGHQYTGTGRTPKEAREALRTAFLALDLALREL